MISRFSKKDNFSAGNILGIIAILLIIIVVVFLIFSNIKINQKRARLEAQVAAVKQQVDELNKGLIEEDNDFEKTAREDLNLKKSGESVVGFILPKDTDKEIDKEGWLKRAFNWFAGMVQW